MGAIDIGSGAIDRSTVAAAGYTSIDTQNPANATGSLTSIEVYFDTYQSGNTLAGTFYGSGTSYTSRDSENLGAITPGSKQTFSGLACAVESGDFLGTFRYGAGDNRMDAGTGGVDSYYKVGDQFGAGTQTYTKWAGYQLSAYGSGETPVVAPTVTTQAVSSVATTTATGNGNITDDGDETPSAWGVCIATTETPDINDTVFEGSGAGAEGAFTASMTGLSSPVKYHARAYATNTEGTSYGADVTFITKLATNAGATASATVAYVTAWTRASAPNLTISATILRSMNRTISTTSDMVVSATVAKALAWTRSTTANLTSAVSIARSRARTIATTANITMSTTISVAGGYTKAVIANLTASVTIAKSWTVTRAITAGLTASATVNRIVAITKTITAGLTVSATVVKSFGRTITTNPNLTISTTISRVVGKIITTSPGLTISATVSRLKNSTIATATNLAISVTIAKALTWTRSITTALSVAVTIAFTPSRFLRLKVTEGNVYILKVTEGSIYRLKAIAGKVYRLLNKEG